MKRIFFLRHAKSDWGASHGVDRERPLAPRGVAAARLVGKFLVAVGQTPQRVVSSSAVRAASTADLVREAAGWSHEVELVDALYGASPEIVLDLVREGSDDLESIMLVGHEPTWSETVGALTGRSRVKMVTAALARVDFSVERWREVEVEEGVLAWLVTPKLLAWSSTGRPESGA